MMQQPKHSKTIVPSHNTRMPTFIAVAMSITPLTGCYIHRYTYEPVSIRVVDGESEQPISDAEIKVGYVRPPGIVINQPEDTSGCTGDDGELVIQIADPRMGSHWSIRHPGYIDHWVQNDSRNGRIPPEFLGDDTVNAVITLFAWPPPSVTVIIADAYRGPLGVRIRPTNIFEPGRRDFIYEASSVGLVEIDASPLLLRRGGVGPFTARYADGRVIPSPSELGHYERPEEVIAVRLVAGVPDGYVYVIGTVADRNAIRSSLSHYVGEYGVWSKFDAEAWAKVFPG